nr:PREDICTED: TBC1 domain family member 17 [Equus przewalskii]
MEGAGYRVVFEKGGVYLHTSAKKHQDPDSLIAGVIRVVEKDNDVLLHWAPVEEAGDSTQIFFSKKDASGSDSCTSEEEPTFDPGYEPDRFLQDPYSTTFGGFSRVTNFFRGALQPHPEGASPDLPPPPEDEPEPGFEVISCVELGPRPAVERAPPVTEEEWARHVGPEGRLQQVPALKARIFSGGLSPGLRREAWKFLLGYLSWEGSAEEHKAHMRKKTRTDRTNKFYEVPQNPGLGLLSDILLTYCMYHFDLGYVQGMSDLLSPILYVIQNEVDAFWCFCGFMELVHGNFEESQETMKRQLGQLLLLLRVLDPPLCDFLDSQDSGSLCFCFRWLLIWFKREFPFPDVLRLWEVLWTGLPGPNLHLLVACAILDMERDTLMLSGFGSNEILKVRPWHPPGSLPSPCPSSPAVDRTHLGVNPEPGSVPRHGLYLAVIGT